MGAGGKKNSNRRSSEKRGDTYHHGSLRETLIDTAVSLLKTRSPEQLSLREVAREAGVSIAAPYRHFKDKRDLLAAIMEQGFQVKFQYMAEAIGKTKGDPQEILFACGIAYFRMGKLHPQHFRLMVSSEIFAFQEFPSLMKTASKSFMLLKEAITLCQRAEIVGSGDPYHKAMNCWCMVNGFTTLYVEGRLTWIGVNEKNAEAALKTLLSQFLIGHREPLKKSDFGFSPFTTPESDLQKRQLIEGMDPEVLMVFKDYHSPPKT